MIGSKSQSNIINLDYNELGKIYSNEELLNYKEFCKRLNIKECAGNSKTKQLRELMGVCKFERIGQKYKIIEIYEEPLEYFDNRKKKGRDDLLNISIEDKNKSGIYKIQLNNIIYIGQTSNFSNRFYQHANNSNGFCKNTQKLLKQGAIFSIIEIVEDKEERINKELEYIEMYSNDENYIFINEKNNYNKPNKNKKSVKQKYKKIKTKEEDYDKVISILKAQGVIIYE